MCRQLNGKDIKFDVDAISEMASAPVLRTTSANVTFVVPNNHKNKKQNPKQKKKFNKQS